MTETAPPSSDDPRIDDYRDLTTADRRPDRPGGRGCRCTRARRDAWMVARVAELSAQERATLADAAKILAEIAAR